MGWLTDFLKKKRLLVAAAAPAEAEAVWAALGSGEGRPRTPWTLTAGRGVFDVVETGVGKAAGAGAVARVGEVDLHGGVLNVGVAGAYPGSGLSVGDVVLATECVFADEGVRDERGFTDISARGFPPGPWAGNAGATDPGLVAVLAALADHQGPIATVSTCSGTDGAAMEIARRTGAIAEAMEGAAIGAACGRIGLPFAELRVISNHTGSDPRWDLARALSRLTEVLGRLT